MKSIEEQLAQLLSSVETLKQLSEREQQFAQHAEQRFVKNLQAFREYYSQVADSIEAFQSDNPLELFVTKTGLGNIRERSSGVPIYGDDPEAQVEEQVNRQLSTPQVNHIDFSKFASASESDERVHVRYVRQLGGVIEELGEPEKLTSIGEYFPTAVVFGLGLGYHIPKLVSRVKFDYIYIVEPEFEHFYLSLFCTDWAAVLEQVNEHRGVLVFHLGASYQNFIDDLYSVSKEVGAYSLTKCFLYRHFDTPSVNELIKQFVDRLFEIHGGYGFYNDATTGLAHTVINAERGFNMLARSAFTSQRYARYPIYIVGNGPSLDASIDFIKETQDEAIIIAAGTALQTLMKNGITPDFHTLVERPYSTYEALVNTQPEQGYEQVNLLTMTLIYPEVTKLYNWVGMAGKGTEAATAFLNKCMLEKLRKGVTGLPFSNPMVSNAALSYAVSLGFKQLYMFGVDNGYAADGQHHSKHSDYYKGNLKKVVQHEAKVELKGNFGGKVRSTNLLAISSQQMGRLLGMPNLKSVECYNVSNGAYVEHALPLRPELVLPEFQTARKTDVIQFIKEQQFENIQVDDFEERMDFKVFSEICDDLIEIGERPIQSRSQATDILRRQSNYLKAYSKTEYEYIYHMLSGELLYFHCPMLSVLFSRNEEADCLEAFHELMALWIEFLQEVKQTFHEDWRTLCDIRL
ncbi:MULTISPECIES: 6-hydroxymethylpterin diphosphokinase MptE-like protein [Idiomarina]|uniref:motility associated factor glycosyltransferase family protein n=1 Tax=Idiomarina TaxID=135575 RepID=UPI000C099C97|nr:hypothetical protein [Idiomarina sp.]